MCRAVPCRADGPVIGGLVNITLTNPNSTFVLPGLSEWYGTVAVAGRNLTSLQFSYAVDMGPATLSQCTALLTMDGVPAVNVSAAGNAFCGAMRVVTRSTPATVLTLIGGVRGGKFFYVSGGTGAGVLVDGIISSQSSA
jgi:hypothetical protein